MELHRQTLAFIRRTLTCISPKLNTSVLYYSKFGKRLDLKTPETLNEKNLWLKFHTYWNNQLVKQCADKYLVREYVKEAGCGKTLNNLIAVYEKPEDLNLELLPNQFVLKLNIGCGFNHIVTDKAKENQDQIIHMMHQWLKTAKTYYLDYSEMQYKDVKPYFIVEAFLGDDKGNLPEDYKFYCLNGNCEMIMFCKDRNMSGHDAKYFYMDKHWSMITNGVNDPDYVIEKPEALEEAIQYAEKLSKPFPYVRVDLYIIGNTIYFGELTFSPSAGMDVDHKLKPFGKDEDIDHIYGRKLVLPSK